ncbi:30S ribosomal protein S7 [Candidatus Woesearchaeota archaeon]|jgi:small subunit ribosomal protein S7|nr:30S ribosomal protein S7 [Candidatus Woesearchaeota archaeon]|tara:strand:+ start:215 stop:817 length:603 start_codon:yes stop_codon:yes gene_type:complete
MQSQIKAFNRWDLDGIKVDDLGLKNYISLRPKIVPKTGARYAKNRFHKSKIFIVERLINKIMIPGHKSKKHFKTSGHTTGKANKAFSIMQNALATVEKQTKENPIKVFVKALENAAQREEIITIEYGGARYPKSVECAPQRRIDVALRHMAQGAYHKSFNSKKSIESTLAEEIINAYRLNAGSNAISKKLEVERQADASR